MLVDGQVKLIDLDDYFTLVTKIPFGFRKKDVVMSLDEIIKIYFNENIFYPFSSKFVESLGKSIKPNGSYESINHYIDEKKKKVNYIFIDDDIDFNKNMELLRSHNYRVIYVYSGSRYSQIEKKMKSAFDLGISLYDVTSSFNMRPYISSIMYDECLGIKGDKILSLKRK